MKEGTSKLLRTYYFIVKQIIDRIGEPHSVKPTINEIFKAFYRNEYDASHTSLKDFEREELNELVNRILIEFSVEYGIYLLQPHDPQNAESMSLSEYFEYLNWSMDNNDFDPFDGINTLPEGFTLIEDIEALKTLKKGKRKRIPENMEWRLGTTLYIYSGREQLYYRRLLSAFTPIDILEKYLKMKILYGTVE